MFYILDNPHLIVEIFKTQDGFLVNEKALHEGMQYKGSSWRSDTKLNSFVSMSWTTIHLIVNLAASISWALTTSKMMLNSYLDHSLILAFKGQLHNSPGICKKSKAYGTELYSKEQCDFKGWQIFTSFVLFADILHHGDFRNHPISWWISFWSNGHVVTDSNVGALHLVSKYHNWNSLHCIPKTAWYLVDYLLSTTLHHLHDWSGFGNMEAEIGESEYFYSDQSRWCR